MKNKLAIHGGTPVKTKDFGSGKKHDLNEWQALKPVFERGCINMTRGPEVMQLREKFCKMTGLKYAATASSGTAALHTALGALEIGRGDEVITSPITDMGTITAIVQQNAVPVFADIDPLTCMITPETVKKKITRHTKAILPVHLAGQPCDVKGIKKVIKGKKIAIVEDLAQSYLAQQGKTQCGTIGDIGCWSLNESKHIGAGDGGILLTNSKKLADRADLFADKCYNRSGGRPAPFFAPYNYRLSTLTAAVCLEQMKKVKAVCSKRNKLGSKLDSLLNKIPGINPRPVKKGDYATYWYYIFAIDPKIIKTDLETFCKAVTAEGPYCGTMKLNNLLNWPLFKDLPDDRHACGINCPAYKGKVNYDIKKFPGMQRAMKYSGRLMMSEFYSAADINVMGKAVAKVAKYYSKNLESRT
ncbi:MAG: DegT/DnrJ/EryC1/StrS family aminotransferase [Planctomycetota bacterium]|jgi:dTDP-4-amino-4,6-dideoxygalactose transaminase